MYKLFLISKKNCQSYIIIDLEILFLLIIDEIDPNRPSSSSTEIDNKQKSGQLIRRKSVRFSDGSTPGTDSNTKLNPPNDINPNPNETEQELTTGQLSSSPSVFSENNSESVANEAANTKTEPSTSSGTSDSCQSITSNTNEHVQAKKKSSKIKTPYFLSKKYKISNRK